MFNLKPFCFDNSVIKIRLTKNYYIKLDVRTAYKILKSIPMLQHHCFKLESLLVKSKNRTNLNP